MTQYTDTNSKMDPKQRFHHPYTPYDVQVQFMDRLYQMLDRKNVKIGILESPTGTGKTLSVICSTMSWVRNPDRLLENESNGTSNTGELSDDDEPDWVAKTYIQNTYRDEIDRIESYEALLDGIRTTARVRVDDGSRLIGYKRRKVSEQTQSTDTDLQEDNDILDDYESDVEIGDQRGVEKPHYVNENGLSSTVADLLSRLEGQTASKRVDERKHKRHQIVFATRTHAQLNQFSQQVKLVSFPSAFNTRERVKYLPLGSRKHLCINKKVQKLRSVSMMNDACLDLQKKAADKKGKGCEFYPRKNDPDTVENLTKFRDISFAQVRDIEDLSSIGSDMKLCPYYAARESILNADIIAVPYQILLQRSTRDALSLSLDSAIVVIDEAHNLIDTITAMNSVSISQKELEVTKLGLESYIARFTKRLNGKNRIYIGQLIRIIDLVQNFFLETLKKPKSSYSPGKVVLTEDIFNGSIGDMFNIHKLGKYITQSKIAYKIESYMEKESKLLYSAEGMPLLMKVFQFLHCFTNTSTEGKFVFDRNYKKEVCLHYMLLDPSEYFSDIVAEAETVILTGGTMEPIDEFQEFLFPKLEKEEIQFFSCDHVIPEENLLVIPQAESVQGCELQFTFEKRSLHSTVEQLVHTIIAIASDTPNGSVFFFPSYAYLEEVVKFMNESGQWERLTRQKPCLCEPRDASKLDEVWKTYKEGASSASGASLLAVIGGKISEGVNFSDELARSVTIVGMPYPNLFSAELIAKRKYIVEAAISRGLSQKEAMEKSKHFYENLCMKAVNQSIGRSIRHINDYAAVILLDSRYSLKHIQDKLPLWVRKRIVSGDKQQSLKNCLRSFFDSRKNNHSTDV